VAFFNAKLFSVFLTYAEEPNIPKHMHSIAHMAQNYHRLKYKVSMIASYLSQDFYFRQVIERNVKSQFVVSNSMADVHVIKAIVVATDPRTLDRKHI